MTGPDTGSVSEVRATQVFQRVAERVQRCDHGRPRLAKRLKIVPFGYDAECPLSGLDDIGALRSPGQPPSSLLCASRKSCSRPGLTLNRTALKAVITHPLHRFNRREDRSPERIRRLPRQPCPRTLPCPSYSRDRRIEHRRRCRAVTLRQDHWLKRQPPFPSLVGDFFRRRLFPFGADILCSSEDPCILS